MWVRGGGIWSLIAHSFAVFLSYIGIKRLENGSKKISNKDIKENKNIKRKN